MSIHTPSTRDRLRSMVEESSTLPTVSQASDALGVSRQRISQLYKSLGMHPERGRRKSTSHTLTAPRLPSSRLRTGGNTASLSTAVVGHVSELVASADLVARGFCVFAPIAQTTAPVDLIVVSRESGKAERIEVRSGVRRDGKISWSRSSPSRKRFSDRYAIVLAGEPVRYYPPYPGDEPVEFIPERSGPR